MAEDKKLFVVGRDAPTEAEACALAEKRFGPSNTIRGVKVEHRLSCPHYLEAIVTDTPCSCPRTVFYGGIGDLAAQIRRM